MCRLKVVVEASPALQRQARLTTRKKQQLSCAVYPLPPHHSARSLTGREHLETEHPRCGQLAIPVATMTRPVICVISVAPSTLIYTVGAMDTRTASNVITWTWPDTNAGSTYANKLPGSEFEGM